MRTVDWIGWAAALLLFANVSRQLWSQWKEEHCEHLSPWFVVGQAATAAGVLLYGSLLGPQVFLVSLALLIVAMSAQLVSVRVQTSRMRQRGVHHRNTRLA